MYIQLKSNNISDDSDDNDDNDDDDENENDKKKNLFGKAFLKTWFFTIMRTLD